MSCALLFQTAQHINGQRENDGGVAFGRDRIERL